jgi:serine/threonine-protein kinase
VAAFLTEARVAALLNHPNIVQIYEVGEHEGTYFIAMEYVAGGTLANAAVQAVSTGTHQTWPFVALVAQAARALHHAHTQLDPNGNPLGLVHRDISPQNIMVRRDGVVKVVDFGIAKVLMETGSRTKTGVIKGKLAYMAPEQVRAESLDCRADLFSLGVVAWELSAGRRMFKGLSEVQLFGRMLEADFPRPSDLVPGYPPALEAVVMKAISRDAKDRFQTGDDMAAALEALLQAKAPQWNPQTLAPYVESLVGTLVASHTVDVTPSTGGTHGTGGTHPSPSLRLGGATNDDEPTNILSGAHHILSSEDAGRTQRPAWKAALVVGALTACCVGLWWSTRAPDVPPTNRVAAPPPEAADPLAQQPTRPVVALPSPVLPPPPQGTPPDEPAQPDPSPRKATSPRKPGHTPARESPQPVAQPAHQESSPAQETADAYLTLMTEPWAVVKVDDKPVGSTPLFKLRLTPGVHQVVLVNDAAAIRKSFSVTLKAGGHERLKMDLR